MVFFPLSLDRYMALSALEMNEVRSSFGLYSVMPTLKVMVFLIPPEVTNSSAASRDWILCATVMAFTFPGGSVLGGATLALMLSRKGKVVLAKGYNRVVSATPHLSTWRLRPLFGWAS